MAPQGRVADSLEAMTPLAGLLFTMFIAFAILASSLVTVFAFLRLEKEALVHTSWYMLMVPVWIVWGACFLALAIFFLAFLWKRWCAVVVMVVATSMVLGIPVASLLMVVDKLEGNASYPWTIAFLPALLVSALVIAQDLSVLWKRMNSRYELMMSIEDDNPARSKAVFARMVYLIGLVGLFVLLAIRLDRAHNLSCFVIISPLLASNLVLLAWAASVSAVLCRVNQKTAGTILFLFLAAIQGTGGAFLVLLAWKVEEDPPALGWRAVFIPLFVLETLLILSSTLMLFLQWRFTRRTRDAWDV